MARPCTICTHPQREEIEAALVGGEPNRRVATRTGAAEASIRRHLEAHVPRALATVKEAREEAAGQSLARRVDEAEKDARRLRDKAEKQGDVRAALVAVKILLDVVELLVKVREVRPDADAPRTIADLVRQVTYADLVRHHAQRGRPPEVHIRELRSELLSLSAADRAALLADLATARPLAAGAN